MPEILEYSPKRPILLTDISPYVIRFWHTLSRVLSLDNIQILDLDIRTMSRKTVPSKVGTIRLQNVAPWVQDLSEEWVEQFFDLVEPGGQVILVHPLSFLFQEGWSFPQPMELTELIKVVMLKDKDNTKLMQNLLKVAKKQKGKWNIFAGHVGEDGRFNQNQSGYIAGLSQSAIPKIYDTVIILQKNLAPRTVLFNRIKRALGCGALATLLVTAVFQWHYRRTLKARKMSTKEKKGKRRNTQQSKNTSAPKGNSKTVSRGNQVNELVNDIASTTHKISGEPDAVVPESKLTIPNPIVFNALSAAA